MIVVGLTGGIGTGKSTISQTLAGLGAQVINADLVGHQAYLPHQNVWQEMVDTFGRGILGDNDEVDRRKLGEIVFSNPDAMKQLNGIVHPWMYRRMEQMIKEHRDSGASVVVLEAAILIEANWTPLVDQVWVVVATEDEVVRRLLTRNNLTEEQIRARIASQMSSDERRKHAQVVVDTNCTLEEVKEQVRRLWENHLSGGG